MPTAIILIRVVPESLYGERLPPLPPGKKGWPWTEKRPSFPERTPLGAPWPRITIVTPSYNQGSFIEETLRSVLLQGYPNLEYFVMDGGSTDGSVEIIRKYEKWLTHWTSEKDRGQSHAINKGFERATGEIIGWLNSDDLLERGALEAVGRAFAENKNLDILFGSCRYFQEGENQSLVKEVSPDPFRDICISNPIHQPSTFWTRRLMSKAGTVCEDLQYAMDWELWNRFALVKPNSGVIPDCLSAFRFHPAHKTGGGKKLARALFTILRRYGPGKGTFAWPAYHLLYPATRYYVQCHRTKSNFGAGRWFSKAVRRLAYEMVGLVYGRGLTFKSEWSFCV